MSQADALLESLAATAANEPVVEGDNIIIGTDRFWSVPEKIKKIGVQYDHNIESITFDCPRYWDNNDMSMMKIYVNYMRADGGTGLYWCENVRVDETDSTIMHFDWTISANATLVQGPLSALVCIKKTGTDGNEENHWNSELCTELYVSEGMQCAETPLRKYPDIITQLLTRMEAAEFEVSPDEVVKKINQALTTNASTQETVAQVAQEYVNNEPAIVYIQNTADTALSIAEGANQALCFATYADMIASFNAFEKGKFRDGQNVYIATVGVPDLWIYSCEEASVPYTYTDDAAIVDVVGNGGTIQAGYYKLGPLETQNVKLRDVAIPLLLDEWDDNLSQTIEVDGIGEDSNPIVMLSYTGEEASDAVLYSYACIKDIDVSTNTIKFTCSEKPKASFTVIVKSVMVNVGSLVSDVTGIVEKINKLDGIEVSNDSDAIVALLDTGWALDETTGLYKQEFEIEGITSDAVPFIGLVSSAIPAPEEEAEAYHHLVGAATGDGTITFYADEVLSTAITVIMKGLSASGGSTVADITEMVDAYNDLREEFDNALSLDFSNADSEVSDVKTLLQKLLDRFYPSIISVPVLTTVDSRVLCSSEHSDGTALGYMVFDDDGSTYWAAATTVNAFIGWDFEEKVAITRATFANKAFGGYGIGTYYIQASNDNGTWTNITNNLTAQMVETEQSVTFNANKEEYRYWRMFINASTNTSNTVCGVRSLNFYSK